MIMQQKNEIYRETAKKNKWQTDRQTTKTSDDIPIHLINQLPRSFTCTFKHGQDTRALTIPVQRTWARASRWCNASVAGIIYLLAHQTPLRGTTKVGVFTEDFRLGKKTPRWAWGAGEGAWRAGVPPLKKVNTQVSVLWPGCEDDLSCIFYISLLQHEQLLWLG